jgi:hypothetical protein
MALTLWAYTTAFLLPVLLRRARVAPEFATGRDKARRASGEMSETRAFVSTENHIIFDPFTETGAKKPRATGTTAKASLAFATDAENAAPRTNTNEIQLHLRIAAVFAR